MMLVYDLGRTHLRAAAYDPVAERLGPVRRAATPADPEAVAPLMRALGLETLAGAEPGTVAIAFPGPVGGGPGSPGGAMRAVFGPRAARTWPGAQVFVMNDVAAAGYALAHRGQMDFALTNVGSNIGQKVFLRGRPVVGVGLRGGEIGHLVVDEAADAPVCDCGERGHLSAIASGRGTLALARRRAEAHPQGYARSALAHDCPVPAALDAAGLLRAFRAGDPFAVAVVRAAARPLAGTLAVLHLALGLERFFVAGGFAQAAGAGYARILAEAAQAQAWRTGQDWMGMIALVPAADEIFLTGCAHAVRRAARDPGIVRLA